METHAGEQRPVEDLTAGDACDFSQVPEGPEEKTALCSDNTALSGVLCVCVCVFSAPLHTGMVFKHQHWSALHLQVRDSTVEEKGARRGGAEVYPRLSGRSKRAGSYTYMLSGIRHCIDFMSGELKKNMDTD